MKTEYKYDEYGNVTESIDYVNGDQIYLILLNTNISMMHQRIGQC